MESNYSKNKIVIQPKGSYFETDDNGYLVNPASAEKIQEKWYSVIDDVIEAYKVQYGDKLKNVYIRGSVAKGEAVDGVSDIDSFAFVDATNEQLKKQALDQGMQKIIEEKYDFVNGVEMDALSSSDIPSYQIVLMGQSLCVYGSPINIPKLRVGKEMALQAPIFHKNIKWFSNFLDEYQSDDVIKKECVWFMKQILRSGFEITMERSKKYTRDFYRCYETFSEYYPEKEPEMREVLYLALNPTSDNNRLQEITNNFGSWLVSEVPKYIQPK